MSLKSSYENSAKQHLAMSNTRGYIECVATLSVFSLSIYLAYQLFQNNVWLSIIFVPILTLTLIRIIVLMHDCVHSSLFKDRKTNFIAGRVLAVITLIPFSGWRWQHLIHHGTVGNLKDRSVGGVFFSTVQEYTQFSPREKICYKLLHNPILFFFLFAQVYFFILLRFNRKNHTTHPAHKDKVSRSVLLNNFAVLLYFLSLYFIFGFHFILTIILPAYWLQQSIAAWFFFVQHIYPDAHYETNKAMTSENDIFSCTSFYKLPGLLAWLTVNIGYHHVHHLYPKIPGYNLKKFFSEEGALQKNIAVFTLKGSIQLYKSVLYDEIQKKFIGWKEHLSEQNPFVQKNQGDS